MAEELKVIDLDQKFLFLAGIRLQGAADGDAATIQFSGPAYTTKVGADGNVTRSKNLNRSALLTYRAMEGSAVNDLLSALFNLDYNSPNGAGVGNFYMKDGQGTTVLKSKSAWIEAPPDITVGAEAGVREWKIRLAKLEGVFGGN